ncbi:MAG: protease complex subunit PrcB family protein [Peptococcia bacterium]
MKEVSYKIIDYPQLPVQVQAFVDKAKYNKITEVFKGEDNSQYVFLSLGTRNTGGYGIEVSRVEEVEGKIVITYQERKPALNDLVIQVITYPWQVIQVDSLLPIVVQKEG